MIAKFVPEKFNQLVTIAKRFATHKIVEIVFVTSEGDIMPLINQSSCRARCNVLEVMDIDTENAKKYLVNKLQKVTGQSDDR